MSLLFCLIYNLSSFSSVYSADKTYSWGPKRHTLALPALVQQLKISDEVMWRTLLYLHSGKLQPRHCLPACLQCWIWAKWPKGNFTAILFPGERAGRDGKKIWLYGGGELNTRTRTPTDTMHNALKVDSKKRSVRHLSRDAGSLASSCKLAPGQCLCWILVGLSFRCLK